jgi:NTP pyrophosphatase (non-canonical NTP hydrolase)
VTGLSFDELRAANIERTEAPTPRGWGHPLNAWSPLEWAGALCGEAGEVANKCKKLRRGDAIETSAIGAELADVVIYADLLCARLGLNLGVFVRETFNAKSRERGMTVFLTGGEDEHDRHAG